MAAKQDFALLCLENPLLGMKPHLESIKVEELKSIPSQTYKVKGKHELNPMTRSRV